MSENKEVQIKLGTIFYVQSANVALLNLCEVGGPRVIVMSVGRLEAEAICRIHENVVFQLPMTHELLKDILDQLDVRLHKVVLTDVRERVYQAELHLLTADKRIVVKARPSDAIALALQCGRPIYALESVLAEAQRQQEGNDEPRPKQQSVEGKLEKCLADKGDLSGFGTDFLHNALQRYVNNEEYEKAILLRDELERRQ